jgi:hypothetical protein
VSATVCVHYEDRDRQVAWQGIGYAPEDGFRAFVTTHVAPRARDDAGHQQYTAALRSIASTGFDAASLEAILAAEEPESRDWAIGEALAEVHLTATHGISWPWNTARDKRNPTASLPGADLIGLATDAQGPLLALGEVKSSSEDANPPQVMSGRSGMVHQLDTLASDLRILGQLLQWLFFRCQQTPHESAYRLAMGRLFATGNRALVLFGVLVRDTPPNERDLDNRGRALADRLQAPTACHLIALYLPCRIAELPGLCSGETP